MGPSYRGPAEEASLLKLMRRDALESQNKAFDPAGLERTRERVRAHFLQLGHYTPDRRRWCDLDQRKHDSISAAEKSGSLSLFSQKMNRADLQFSRELGKKLAELAIRRQGRKTALLIGTINGQTAREHFLASFLTAFGFE